ncbi:MAG: L-rhamnose/proton symporter RhaT [Verrucomicrobiota bacterium JB022]|nr:L-rhamnose/proton symporter RhaT [Verrucomicrobiota bacterium JB022]
MNDAPLIGTLLHTVGAASAALCYSPQKFLHKWSWQTYWMVQAMVCWLLLPWIGAYFSVPDGQLFAVLAEAPKDAMLHSFLYGMLYGVGGIAFGLSIRYIGFSLTYAIAIGFSCLIGTLFMPLIKGQLGATLSQDGGMLVIGGVVLGFVAMILTGVAGFRKENELAADGTKTTFNAHIGLPICVLAGVLSAVFNFALESANPVAELAAQFGAGQNQENVKYITAMNGSFVTTVVYVLILANKNRSWGEFGKVPDAAKGKLLRNYGLAAATGLMWYTQFFFYGRGHVLMGDFKFSSWAIHMIILILLSSGFGVLIGEWKGARAKTLAGMGAALALLFGAVGLITYGNYLGSQATDTAPVPVEEGTPGH